MNRYVRARQIWTHTFFEHAPRKEKTTRGKGGAGGGSGESGEVVRYLCDLSAIFLINISIVSVEGGKGVEGGSYYSTWYTRLRAAGSINSIAYSTVKYARESSISFRHSH